MGAIAKFNNGLALDPCQPGSLQVDTPGASPFCDMPTVSSTKVVAQAGSDYSIVHSASNIVTVGHPSCTESYSYAGPLLAAPVGNASPTLRKYHDLFTTPGTNDNIPNNGIRALTLRRGRRTVTIGGQTYPNAIGFFLDGIIEVQRIEDPAAGITQLDVTPGCTPCCGTCPPPDDPATCGDIPACDCVTDILRPPYVSPPNTVVLAGSFTAALITLDPATDSFGCRVGPQTLLQTMIDDVMLNGGANLRAYHNITLESFVLTGHIAAGLNNYGTISAGPPPAGLAPTFSLFSVGHAASGVNVDFNATWSHTETYLDDEYNPQTVSDSGTGRASWFRIRYP